MIQNLLKLGRGGIALPVRQIRFPRTYADTGTNR